MKKLYLASSIDLTAQSIAKDIGKDPRRLDFAYKPENKIIILNDRQYVKVENDMYKIVEIDKVS